MNYIFSEQQILAHGFSIHGQNCQNPATNIDPWCPMNTIFTKFCPGRDGDWGANEGSFDFHLFF
jgi:hypothetical protein